MKHSQGRTKYTNSVRDAHTQRTHTPSSIVIVFQSRAVFHQPMKGYCVWIVECDAAEFGQLIALDQTIYANNALGSEKPYLHPLSEARGGVGEFLTLTTAAGKGALLLESDELEHVHSHIERDTGPKKLRH